MAESINEASEEIFNDNRKLQDVFIEGWNMYEELQSTSLASNSVEFQHKVSKAIKDLELVTRIVSDIGMFSSNEFLEEIPTESLQYLLLPFLLGKLTQQIQREDRLELLNIADIYLEDFLKRCEEYGLYEARKEVQNAGISTEGGASEMTELMQAARFRNAKLEQFKFKKELENHIKNMRAAVLNNTCNDEEERRDFFIKLLKMSIIESEEDLKSIRMEKQMVQMRQMHISSKEKQILQDGAEQSVSSLASNSSGNEKSKHRGQHHHHQHQLKPRPLKPFIITRNAAQKSVFGMGYPSLPIMTVNEFYQQRVDEGIFPDDEKMAAMNRAQATMSAVDPNEKDDEERAVVELQIENDDPEYIARMRRMDEYKDVVRRGDGNRHNRS